MEFDRKTILAFVLIGVILLLINTDFYQRMMFSGAPAPKPATDEYVKQIETDASEQHQELGEKASVLPTSESRAQSLYELYAGVDSIREEKYLIETPLYIAEMSNKGAVLRRVQLKNYLNTEREPVTIFADEIGSPSVLLPIGEDTLDTANLMFYTVGQSVKLEEKQNSTITFTHRQRDGQEVRKTFTFAADKYDIDLQVDFSNIRTLISPYSYGLHWQSPLLSTEQNVKEDMGHAKVYAFVDRELEEVDIGDSPSNAGNTTWLAGRTKYFACAIIPLGKSGDGLRIKGQLANDAHGNQVKQYSYSLFMPLYGEGSEAQRFKLFIGPLNYRILKSYDVDLHRMMGLGWKWVVEPFSILTLTAFTFLHQFIPNYGVVIVVFSVLVKLILNPLTRRSTRSMKEMQLLQPKIAELRQKHEKDPQRLNQETMKLYKEHGVNPLGGCLPTLLQMPLLFALFVVFSSTIELRQAPFVLWIKDLSVADTILHLPWGIPLNVLPLVMGATMFLQQKMTMTDPKQKFMLYSMPIIFTFMFYNFPSGLTLYYSLFNIMSLVQQKYFTGSGPIELKKKKTKARPWQKLSFNAALARGRSTK